MIFGIIAAYVLGAICTVSICKTDYLDTDETTVYAVIWPFILAYWTIAGTVWTISRLGTVPKFFQSGVSKAYSRHFPRKVKLPKARVINE